MYGSTRAFSRVEGRGVRAFVVLAFACLAITALLIPTVAHATIIRSRNWSVQPRGTVTTAVPLIVSGGGSLDAYPLDSASLLLSLDGRVVPRAEYTAATPAGRNLYVYWLPTMAFPDGPHSATVSVADTLGRVSAYQWNFVSAIPPRGSWTAPAAGAHVRVGFPGLAVTLSDNDVAPSLAFAGEIRSGTVDGPVVATFGGNGLGAGTHTFTPSNELAPGTYHLRGTVTDAGGRSAVMESRVFSVVAPPAMTIAPQDCTATGCHVSAGHPGEGMACESCHVAVPHEYSRCEDCHDAHGSPVTVTGVFGPCTVCHDPDNTGVRQHTAQGETTRHVSGCDGCHAEDLVARHAVTPQGGAFAYQCDLCHDSANTRVAAAVASGDTSCGACHDREASHGDLNAIHEAGITSASIQVMSGPVGPHPPTSSDVYSCGMCHATKNLLTLHGTSWRNCAMCHADGAPRSTFEAWDKTCQQGSCHVVLHNQADADREHAPPMANGGQCQYCHDGEGERFAYERQACTTRCHGVMPAVGDAGAPLTSVANPAAYFKDPAQVQLTAIDAGSSVTGTYYRVDGGEWKYHLGATTNVSLPANGSGLLEFYSVDWFGNTEEVRSYTVTFDVTPPVTLDDIATQPEGYPVHLTASDVGSGVAATYFSVDGEPFRSYGYIESIEGIRNDGGGGVHTLSYYSVDVAGNIAPIVTVEWVVSDRTPPTSTLSGTAASSANIQSVDAYGDNPCGIKEIRYRLDGGSWVVTSFPRERPYFTMPRRVDIVVPADGVYQLEYYAVDWADNAETPRTTTLTIDGVAPSLTVGAADSYAGNATVAASATDVGSGVATISYRLDSYPVVNRVGANTNISLPAPATGSRTYTLSVWATDNAGNTSAMFGPKTIVVSAPPDVTKPVTNLRWRSGLASYLTVANGSSFNPGTQFNFLTTDSSGIDRLEYRIDGGALQTVSGTAATQLWVDVAIGPGVHTVSFNAVDRAGNVENAKTITLTVLTEPMTLLFEMSNTLYPGVTWESSNYVYDVRVLRGEALVHEASGLQTVDEWSGTPIQYKGFSFWDFGDGPYTVEMVLHSHNNGDRTYVWPDVSLSDGETLTLNGTYEDDMP